MKLAPFALVAMLLASLAGAQDLSKRVDYRTVAIPTSRALAAIGEQAGVKIQVDEPLASQPLILSVKQAPLKKLLDRVADALGGEWRIENRTVVLFRSQQLTDKLTQQGINIKANLFAEMVQNYLQSTEKAGLNPAEVEDYIARLAKLDPKSAEAKALAEHTPPAFDNADPRRYVATQVLPTIDPILFAESWQGLPLYLSTEPLRNQRLLELPDGATERIVEQVNLASELSKTLQPILAVTDPDVYGEPTSEELPILDPHRTRVVVQLGIFGDIGICLVGQDGKEFVSNTVYLEEPSKDRKTVPWLTGLPPCRPSSVTKDWLAIKAGKTAEPSVVVQPSAALREALSHPETNDPLSLAVSDLFLGIADAKNLNVVAAPSDRFCLHSLQATDFLSDPASRLLNAMQLGARAVCEGSWLMYGEGDPLEAERERVSRTGLGELVRSYADKGFGTFDDAAEYRGSDASDGRLARYWLQYVNPAGPWSPVVTDAAKFWGGLDSSIRDRLVKGETVRAIQLDATSLEALNKVVQIADYGPGGASLQADAAHEGLAEGDALARFDPNTATIRYSSSPDWIVSLDRGNGKGYRRILADDIAKAMAYGEDVSKLKFSVRQAKRHRIYVQIEPGLEVYSAASESWPDLKKDLHYIDLPEDFRKRVDQARKDVKLNPEAGTEEPPSTEPPV